MEFRLMVTIQCDDCKTWYEPEVRPESPVRDPAAGRERDWCVVARFVPRCPSCTAVGAMLRRAGLRGLAREFE
jgi:hypothetical protein